MNVFCRKFYVVSSGRFIGFIVQDNRNGPVALQNLQYKIHVGVFIAFGKIMDFNGHLGVGCRDPLRNLFRQYFCAVPHSVINNCNLIFLIIICIAPPDGSNTDYTGILIGIFFEFIGIAWLNNSIDSFKHEKDKHKLACEDFKKYQEARVEEQELTKINAMISAFDNHK